MLCRIYVKTDPPRTVWMLLQQNRCQPKIIFKANGINFNKCTLTFQRAKISELDLKIGKQCSQVNMMLYPMLLCLALQKGQLALVECHFNRAILLPVPELVPLTVTISLSIYYSCQTTHDQGLKVLTSLVHSINFKPTHGFHDGQTLPSWINTCGNVTHHVYNHLCTWTIEVIYLLQLLSGELRDSHFQL